MFYEPWLSPPIGVSTLAKFRPKRRLHIRLVLYLLPSCFREEDRCVLFFCFVTPTPRLSAAIKVRGGLDILLRMLRKFQKTESCYYFPAEVIIKVRALYFIFRKQRGKRLLNDDVEEVVSSCLLPLFVIIMHNEKCPPPELLPFSSSIMPSPVLQIISPVGSM